MSSISPPPTPRVLILLDRWWLPIAAAGFVCFAVLNYHDFLTVALDRNYYWFGAFLRNGFSPPPGTAELPTFPLWGYGWLLAITTSRAVLLASQCVLALGSVAVLVRYLESRRVLPVAGVRILKTLLLFSVPWYAQHVVLWPNSVAVSLVLISLVLFARSAEPRLGGGATGGASKWLSPWSCVIASGLLLGVALNFRSDLWLYPLGAAPALIYSGTPRGAAALRSLVWLLVIAASLAPWMIYTRWACGHFVPTSTNSGQVMFIGLGALPNNRWNITPYDEDPMLHRILAEHFGRQESPFTYEADQFLKREAMRRIKDDPGEYVRKCVYSFRSAIFSGAYVAKFYRRSDDDTTDIADLPIFQREFLRDPSGFVGTRGFGLLVRLLATVTCDRIAKLIVPLGYLSWLIAFPLAIRRRHTIVVLGGLAIAYQTAIITCLNSIPMYMSNIYLWHLLMLSYATWSVWDAASRRAPGSTTVASDTRTKGS